MGGARAVACITSPKDAEDPKPADLRNGTKWKKPQNKTHCVNILLVQHR